MRTVNMKANITLKELEQCVEYAKEHGVSRHKTITLTLEPGFGLGNTIGVAANWKDEPIDITNYDAF